MVKNGHSLSDILASVAVLCAVIITVLVVRREIWPSAVLSRSRAAWDQPFDVVSSWSDLSNAGAIIGPTDAKVKIVVFSDFECPACRSFTLGALASVRRAHPRDVAILYRHFPLNYHRFAMPAARAATCAARQQRFVAFHDELFREQDSLGFVPFRVYASRVGVGDLDQFEACIRDTAPMPEIEQDLAAASTISVDGTPTIIINGMRLPAIPDSARLVKIIQPFLDAAKS